MEKRIPYPISAQYCENWGVVEALREIAANMLDAQSSYRCYHEAGVAMFHDDGVGFEPHCLMFGEGELKSGQQIGQFKEGLKLALLVLARMRKKILLETTGFTITRVAMESTDLGRDGLVLYVDTEKRREYGTHIEIGCSAEDFKAATSMFLNLRVVGDSRPVIDSKIFDSLRKKGGIYVNGLLTEESDLAWSYNFNGDAIKGSMNRDRTVLDSYEVTRMVREAWEQVRDVTMIVKFLERTKLKKECRENSMFSSRYHSLDKDLWLTALCKHLGIDPANADKLAMQDAMDKMNREARELGFTVINHNRLSPAANTIYGGWVDYASDVVMTAVTKAMKRKRKRHRTILGSYDVVPWAELTSAQRDRLNEAGSIAISILLKSSLVTIPLGNGKCVYPDKLEFFVYDNDTLREDSQGAWCKGHVGIRLSHLANDPLELVVGTIIHEIAHAASGADDCTRDFENRLTLWLGNIAVNAAEDKQYGRYDVTTAGNSRNRMEDAPLPCDPRVLSFETIVQACELETASGKVVRSYGHDRNKDKARKIDWQYEGATFDTNRKTAHNARATSQTVIFRGKTKTRSHVQLFVTTKHVFRHNKEDVKIEFSYVFRSHWVKYHSDIKNGYFSCNSQDWQELPLEEAWPELIQAAGWSSAAAASLGVANV